MAKTVLILGDQLSEQYLITSGFIPAFDTILMVEDTSFVKRQQYHRRKVVLVWSAMRHFRDTLLARGYTVRYVERGSLRDQLEETRSHIVCIKPREQGIRIVLATAGVDIIDDPFWFIDDSTFTKWMDERKQPRLEHYYRMVRQKTGFLMDAGQPAGGVWNFDRDNRKPFPKGHQPILQPTFAPDSITTAVMHEVNELDGLLGDVAGFSEPVTRSDALERLNWFIINGLSRFGPYEDAMSSGDMFGYHSVLATLLNLSLLSPRECIERAIQAFEEGMAPIASVEAFVRQVLGWREYMYHLYEWLGRYRWDEQNHLCATESLPSFYWTGDTQMHCLKTTIQDTLRTGYAHHIIRLMVQGNFALLLGVQPAEVRDWFWCVFIDAYDWVVTPNVIGMSQAADNGLTASKPYVASGAYINRMSDYCRSCVYKPSLFAGDTACPFSTLYWDFLIRHENSGLTATRLQTNYLALRGKTPEDREAIRLRKKEIGLLIAAGQL